MLCNGIINLMKGDFSSMKIISTPFSYYTILIFNEIIFENGFKRAFATNSCYYFQIVNFLKEKKKTHLIIFC